MSRYSILELPWPIKDNSYPWGSMQEYFDVNYDRKTEPVFSRHGVYIDRIERRAWIECEMGCAELSYEHEKYHLDRLDTRPLHPREVKAIEELLSISQMDSRILKQLDMVLYWDYDRKQSITTRRNASIESARIIGEKDD